VGFPGIQDDLEDTLRLGESLRAIWEKHEVKVHFYAPYPGTPLWNEAIRHGFKPPGDLDGWSEFDYYAVTTPWVDPAWQDVVRSFNQTHCPYVHV
jgi:anaerobic magnesium-protoporphyrin IX monomethyl ester cyclase